MKNMAKLIHKEFPSLKSLPPDPIIGISEAFKKDSNPKKVSLGVGAYRDDAGKPWTLPCVAEAQKMQLENPVSYTMDLRGYQPFVQNALKVAYGEELAEKRNFSAVQCYSGTGGVRLGVEFLAKALKKDTHFYYPNKTWPIHHKILNFFNLNCKEYPYYNAENKGLDYENFKKTVHEAPHQSVFLLHVCAHNPTGVDVQKAQWKELKELFVEKGHIAFFDMAYQGFATGDLENDAFAVREFAADERIPLLLTQSFAKNMGLYGHRIGCLSVVVGNPEEEEAVSNTLQQLAAQYYTSLPFYGARIAELVMSTPSLRAQWHKDLQTMSSRIHSMRESIVETLKAEGSQLNWSHVTSQIGMFAYTGMTTPQVERLAAEFSIFLTKDGRVSMAGLNSGNVEYVGKAIHEVTH